MASRKLYVFGPPRLVEHDGHPVELHLRKALALLVYLAVTDQPQSRDSLAALLWPDSSQREARANLRRTLYRLGQALGGDVLLSSDTIRLHPHADLWLDYKAFLQHLKATRDGMMGAEHLVHLTAAAELYTDDFLAGFTLSDSPAFDEWQFFQRESLRQSIAQVLIQLVTIHRSQQTFIPAIAYARRWLALDLLHEPAHRALMELYALAGQHTAALRQYGECARVLEAELGVEPDNETTALYEAIRARRFPTRLELQAATPSRQGPAAHHYDHPGATLNMAATSSTAAELRLAVPLEGAAVEAAAGATSTFTVGREAELRSLRERLDRALGGARQLVFVSGEAGLGKTTLVNAFIEEIKSNPALRIGHGQCLEHRGTGEAYMPLLEALERMCREPGGQELIELLVRRAPTWLIQMPWLISDEQLAALQHRVIGTTRERMLREMVEMLGMLTAKRPLVLVLEDLHWSDYSTLDLTAALARRQDPACLMVIGTYRPLSAPARAHPLYAVAQELCVRGYGTALELAFLSEAAVRAYLGARFPEAAFLDELAPLVHQRTEGNPLFMVGVVNSWLAQGSLAQADGRWTLRAGLDELAVGTPESLRHLIELQLSQLDPLDQAILEAASVAGVEFSTAALAAGVSQAEEDVEVRCAALARQDCFLRAQGTAEWPDGTVAARYGFIHHLYGEVLYERITAGRRVRLHQEIGGRLEAGYGTRAQEVAAELAVHFVRGREPKRAVRYLQLAAQQAVQRSAHREAIAHLTSGLEILQGWPDTPERARAELTLQAMLAPALVAADGWGSSQAEEAYERGYELCERLGDAPQRSQVMFGLAAMLEFRAQYQKSQALMEARLSLPDGSQSGDWRLESHDLLACSLFHQGAFERALEQADQGLALYNREQQYALIATLGDDPGVDCHIWAALSLWFLGYPERALKRIHIALELAQTHLYSLANARVQAAFIHQCRREERLTLQWAEAAVALATAQGFPYRVMVGTTLRGWAMSAKGQHEEGIAQLHEGLTACREAGIFLDYPYFLALLAEAYACGGQIDKGLAALAEAQTMVQSSRTFFFEAELHRLKGFLLLRANESNAVEAQACFRQGLEVARQQGAKSLELRAATSLGYLWRQQGKIIEAHQILDEIYSWFTEGFETADLREARALLEELSGNGKHNPRPLRRR